MPSVAKVTSAAAGGDAVLSHRDGIFTVAAAAVVVAVFALSAPDEHAPATRATNAPAVIAVDRQRKRT